MSTQRRFLILLISLTVLLALWDFPLIPARLHPQAAPLLAVPTVPERVTVLGYEREHFGAGWAALPQGTTVREEIIAQQLGGQPTGTDPYSGALMGTTGGVAHPIEVDHIFPLAAAWDMGAHSWDSSRRAQFANDPLNLVAVAAGQNRKKSDQLPGDWLPPDRDARCAYAHRVAAVALAYELPVTEGDRAAMVHACQLTLGSIFGLV